jgi:hypothetical protein
MMAKVTVHAGDFKPGQGSFTSLLKDRETGIVGAFTLRTEAHAFIGETILVAQLASVEIASEEAVKRVGGTVGWGLAGAALLGPVGLLAGLLAGGRGKDVTFVARFKDGRRLLATTDSKTFTMLQAAIFK